MKNRLIRHVSGVFISKKVEKLQSFYIGQKNPNLIKFKFFGQDINSVIGLGRGIRWGCRGA
nr:hypothetical protein [uncultured Desulfobacter sp.]